MFIKTNFDLSFIQYENEWNVSKLHNMINLCYEAWLVRVQLFSIQN